VIYEYPTAAAAAELVTDTPGKAVKPVAIGGGGLSGLSGGR